MFFSRPPSYLGIDLGAGGVKIVELRQEKKRPVLHTYGLASVPKELGEVSDNSVENYAKIIKQICRSAKTISKKVTVSLPSSVVFHALVTLPVGGKKEANDLILDAEVRKLLPQPLEEMVVDYQMLPVEKDAKNQLVLVTATSRTLNTTYSRIFQRAGLELQALEPEASALTRSLVGRDDSLSMVVDIGAERTNFFIVERGVPLTHNSIEAGGNKINRILERALALAPELVEQAKFDLFRTVFKDNDQVVVDRLLSVLMPVIDPIVKEVAYSIEVFARQESNHEKRLEKIILAGGASLLPGFAGYMGEKLKVKCYVGDPWSRVVYQDGLRPVIADLGPRMAVAIGLALRTLT